MKSKAIRRRGILLTAAVAAISGLTLVQPASAQYAAGQDGHAQDANNRVGSNGTNNARPGSTVTSNNIVDRTVTGGRGFSGPIGERDPRAFSGPVPSGLDTFNRRTVGPNAADLPTGTYGQPQAYYGDSRFVAPPSGSLPLGFNGGYIGTTLNTPMSLSSSMNESKLAVPRTIDHETLLTTEAINSGKYDTLQTLDTNLILNQNGMMSISPVLGQRNYFNGTGEFISREQLDRLSPEDANIVKMQDELRLPAPPIGAQPQPAKTENGANEQQSTSLNQPLNSPLNPSLGAPANGAISSQVNATPLNGTLNSTGVISPDAGTTPSLLPPSQQSTLLATLQERLATSSAVGKAIDDAAPKVTPSNGSPANATANNGGGATVVPNRNEGPIKVASLATGVKAKGFHDLLIGAEDSMRNGKFDEAVDKYNTAQRVAPNNPLPLLGRAHAELGGGYYAQAETDLRKVFRSDPELLTAQFDLPAVLPKDRIEFMHKDLMSLTESDPKAERPWFLAAYLDYNTGNTAAADKELKEAETRANGDWSVRLLRQHWTLPNGKAVPNTGAKAPANSIRRTTTPPASQPSRPTGSQLNK